MKKILNNFYIQSIILLGSIYLLEKFIWYLILWINTRLAYSPKLIFITPGTYSYRGDVLAIIIFFTLLIFIFWFGYSKIRQYNIRAKMFGYVLTTVCIMSFIIISINNSALYENKIYYRGLRNLVGKTYLYSDIKSVHIYVSTGRNNTGAHYELIMKDGVVINLTSKEDNYKFIPQVEKNINKGIPHTICKWDYNYLKDTHEIPYSIYRYFEITR